MPTKASQYVRFRPDHTDHPAYRWTTDLGEESIGEFEFLPGQHLESLPPGLEILFDGEEVDFLPTGFDLPIVSDELRKLLAESAAKDLKFFRVNVVHKLTNTPARKKYLAMHARRRFDCNAFGDPIFLMLHNVPKTTLVFGTKRVWQWPGKEGYSATEYYMHHSIAEKVRSRKTKAISFESTVSSKSTNPIDALLEVLRIGSTNQKLCAAIYLCELGQHLDQVRSIVKELHQSGDSKTVCSTFHLMIRSGRDEFQETFKSFSNSHDDAHVRKEAEAYLDRFYTNN